MNKIIAKILSDYIIKVRDLLDMDISINVTDDFNGQWNADFKGPVELTADGIARWSMNNILDKEIAFKENKAIVQGIKNDNECKQLCSLFNTINKNVNDATYQKYIKKEK